MKRILWSILILGLIVTIILLPDTDAAGVTLGVSASRGTVNPGDTVTVNINLGGSMGAATVNLAFNNSLFDYTSATGGTANNLGSTIRIVFFDNTGGSKPTSSMSVTFRAKAVGTGTFTATGTGFANADATVTYSPVSSGSTSVKVEEKVTPPMVSTPETSTPTNPPETSTPEASTPSNPSTPPPASNTPTNIPPTSNSGNNTTGNAASSNAFLKTLRLNREGITPAFSKNTLNYSITVDTSVDSIEVTATPEDSRAQVSVSGNTRIKSWK